MWKYDREANYLKSTPLNVFLWPQTYMPTNVQAYTSFQL